jgi:hypothetical protein
MKLRGPVLWRNLGGLALVAGAACFAAAVAYGRKEAKNEWLVGLGIFGAMLGLVGALVVYNTYTFARDYQRLTRGEDVIARWHVDEAQWRAFVALIDALSREQREVFKLGPGLANSGGVEVIVGKAALLVGNEFQSLEPDDRFVVNGAYLIEAAPVCLEFGLRMFDGESMSWLTRALRVPVARGAESDARRVVAHFARS